MIKCNNCGNDIPDTSRFCGVCGAPVNNYAPVNNVDVGIYREKECLDNFHRFLKYERLCWKICAIVWFVLAGLFGFLGLIFLISAENGIMAVLGFEYMFIGVLYLPVAIVNLKMIGKAEHYMNIVYNDINSVTERCGHVGMIVLSAFFNTIAMIFIIINFTRTKTNKAEIQSAAARQAQFNSNNNY